MDAKPDPAAGRHDRRLTALAQASAQFTFRADPDWTVVRAITRGGGIPAGDAATGRALLTACIPEDEMPRVTAAIEEAIRTRRTFALEHRVRRADGSVGWALSRAVPVPGADGGIEEWIGSASDITTRREAQAHQQLLRHELQHRVRTILAAVRSIVRGSADTVPAADDYVRHLDGRLAAVSRTQALLIRTPGTGIELEDILRDELVAQVAADDRVRLDGPAIMLAPGAAEVLTLAVHELATNAVKYGALSRDGGSIAVHWERQDRGGETWLAFRWEEAGVPVIDEAPRHEGFGTHVVTRRVAHDLNGDGTLAFRPGGLVCRIEFPLIPANGVLRTSDLTA